MFNSGMRNFDYYLFEELNEYGQPALSEKKGTVKMYINIASQAVQQSINYTDCSYIGLTRDKVTDKYVIQYGTEKLKVLYVNPKGRLNQVFLGRM